MRRGGVTGGPSASSPSRLPSQLDIKDCWCRDAPDGAGDNPEVFGDNTVVLGIELRPLPENGRHKILADPPPPPAPSPTWRGTG